MLLQHLHEVKDLRRQGVIHVGFPHDLGDAQPLGGEEGQMVISVDSSAPALEAATRNWALNRQFPGVAAAAHEAVAEDAFEVLARWPRRGVAFA